MKTVGVIRGKTIELETSTDLPDGQAVEVGINLLAASTPAQGKTGSLARLRDEGH